FLTTTDPSVKVTRSQTKALIGSSREASRSNTPTLSSKLLTPDDTSRGSASPTPQPAPKGRQRKGKAAPQRATKRKAAERKKEAEPAVETVVISSSSVAENQASTASSSDKPPIVLKLTLKKADKPAKKEKRSSSEKTSKERKKKEKKSSLDTVISPPPSQVKDATQLEKSSTQETEMEVDQPSSQTANKAVPVSEDSATEARPNSPASMQNSESTSKPAQVTGRRRALHLLPGPISINEPLTAQVLNNMLRELEIKYYGDDERHPYSQDV
ncbi:hypothetical protein TELCIR_23318, partial [Teladorsagia circumcincta]